MSRPMNYQKIKAYLLSKPGARETYPFGPDPLVVKIGGKIYALVSVDSNPCRITLKCLPDDGLIQRNMYPAIQPGYHMNKEHWNTITVNSSIPDGLLRQLMDDSYRLVLKRLTQKESSSLENENWSRND